MKRAFNQSSSLAIPLMLLSLTGVTAAQPSSAPVPAAVPGSEASAAGAGAATPTAAPAAAPEAIAEPLEPAPGAPPPAAEAPPPSPAPAPPPSATPAEPPASDYDGPPLLFDRKKHHLGAYGGLGVAYTRMLHRDGVVANLEASALVDHRASLGVAAYAFSRTPRGPARLDGTRREYAAAYGGLVARYAVYTNFPVYASFGVLIGGGGLGLYDEPDEDWDDDGDDWRDDDDDEWHEGRVEAFFVAQPDITLHVNATRWLRFGVTGGYRFATAVSEFGYDATAMSGAVVGGNIQFGWF